MPHDVPQGGRPSADKTAEIGNLPAEKVAPLVSIPPTDSREATKLQQSREVTVREMVGIARELVDVQEELRRAETRLDGVSLTGPDREKLRKHRNLLKDRLEGLEEARAAGQKRLNHLDQLLRLDSAETAASTRRGTQDAIVLVRDGIIETLYQVVGLYQQLQELKREYQLQADIVRPLAPDKIAETKTFDYLVDPQFEGAIAQAISECVRTAKVLKKRKTNGDTP